MESSFADSFVYHLYNSYVILVKIGGGTRMQPFAIYELLFYILPIVAIFVAVRFVRPMLREVSSFPLTLPMLWLPLWIVIIEGFGWRLYDMSFFPMWCDIMLLVLWLHYFDYIRRVDAFEWRPYLKIAAKLMFTTSSLLLIGMAILRIFTYIF